jgi:hypothetical protein
MVEVQSAVGEAQVIAAYNYASFLPDGHGEEFRCFPSILPVGSKAPDFTATLLDGRQVRLSDYTRRGPTVIEFGSIT